MRYYLGQAFALALVMLCCYVIWQGVEAHSAELEQKRQDFNAKPIEMEVYP